MSRMTKVWFQVERHHGHDVWHMVGAPTDSVIGAQAWRDFLLRNEPTLSADDLCIVRTVSAVVDEADLGNSDISG